MIASPTGKAFAVLFKDLRRWSVNSFFKVAWRWADDIVKPLSIALERKVVPLDKRKADLSNTTLIRLHFDGEMEPRDADAATFKGRLFIASCGDVIYSKIDVRNGAIGVVPNGLPTIAVSSEYPTYRVRPNIALPHYVKLVFRTEVFRRQINSLISGASGRKRVQPADLEELRIPLPHPSIQHEIVDFLQASEIAVEGARNALLQPVLSLNNHLTDIYRKACSQDVIHSRFFALNFQGLDAWDVKSGRASAFRIACPSFRPMGDFIEEVTELVRPSDEPEKDWPVYGVNNKEGVFLSSYQKGELFNAPYKRIRKDWFFHNPTRCNVGSLGIVPDVPPDAITSPEYQVWRLRDDTSERLLPSFVGVLIQTPFFLELVQFNRVGGVKQRMYTENLCQLRIPYLREHEQREYAEMRDNALTDLLRATEGLKEARTKVEEMILGTRKVPKR